VTRLYYGWVLVITLGITETISWGILYYAFTVFLAPMEADLGWSRGAMTGALSLALLLAGVAAVPVGRWLDRHGPRLLMTLGSCIGSLLVLAWARVGDLTSFYLVWAAIGISMAALLYDPAFATVTAWFERERLRAITAVTLMAGLASTIFIPLAQALVSALGWRQALVVLAAILAVGTILPHALLLRPAPSRAVREGVSLGDALRHASFRWVVAAFCLTTLANGAMGVHLVPYLHDRGYDPGFAAAAAGLIGAMQVVARVVLAPLGDRASPRVLTALVLAIEPLALVVLLLARETSGVFAFVVLFGAARGATTLVRPVLTAALYGRSEFASIAGVLQMAVSFAQALAPVGVGAGYDALGSYEPILWGLVVLSALAVLAILPARSHATGTVEG
jgi:MFS family permease